MNEIKTRNPTAMSAYFGILILRLRISGLFLLGILFVSSLYLTGLNPPVTVGRLSTTKLEDFSLCRITIMHQLEKETG
ncbi:hypothetical protein, partial [Ileibacterium valens]|uniref:hypothetical protein n=1 Tax=Ileibacterium valens TaxID=1862668 RepID=UPI0024B96E38